MDGRTEYNSDKSQFLTEQVFHFFQWRGKIHEQNSATWMNYVYLFIVPNLFCFA